MKRKYLAGVLGLVLVLLSACAAPEMGDVSAADPSPAAGTETDTYAGDFCKIVVKYQNPGIQKMELLGLVVDSALLGIYDYEIIVDVEGNPEKGVYIASCPEFEGKIEFSVGRQVDDMRGGNCRGFYSLQMGEYQGEEVLLGYEYLYAGGIVDYVGDAVFVIGWDEGGTPYVRDWYIEGDMSSAG